MKHTIVGIFDRPEHARAACDALAAAGVAGEDVSVHAHEAPEAPVPTTEYTDSNAQATVFERIEHLFGKLFGEDDRPAEAGAYAEAVRRGCTLVAAEVDEAQVEPARLAMWREGAVDIEDRADRWRAAGWAGWDPAAAPYPPDQAEAERVQYADTSAPRPDIPPAGLRAYRPL